MSESELLIAIVDDEEAVRKALGRLFRSAGFLTVCFASGREFFESLSSRKPDCLVLDLHLPEINGMDILNHVVSGNILIPTVMITGHDMPGMKDFALASGASAYLLKPLDDATLIEAVLRSIRKKANHEN